MTADFIKNYDLDLKETKGFTLTLDLDYPERLHDLHNSYPLVPEKRSIKKSELWAYLIWYSFFVARIHYDRWNIIFETMVLSHIPLIITYQNWLHENLKYLSNFIH